MAPQIPGLNLSYLVDYRQQCPFKNELRMARVFWEANSNGTFFAQRLTNEHPDTGYPLSLVDGRIARTTFGTGNYRVGGTWSISFDGSGQVEIDAGNGTRTFVGGGGAYGEFERNPNSSVQITIRSTSTADPVRNMWIGETTNYASRNDRRLRVAWRDHIVQARIKCLRFMQWQRISPAGDTGSLVRSYHPGGTVVGLKSPRDALAFNATGAEYFTDSDYLQGNGGAPPDANMGNGCTLSSLLIAAIELQEYGLDRIWLCVPHLVDEGIADLPFVRALLQFVRDFRHPSMGVGWTGRILIEYSNETWNSTFPQHSYCNARGTALGLAGSNDSERGHSFYALRSKQVFDTALLARSQLGITNEIETVLAGQAGSGEYPFRFRTQIGATSPTPVNVTATYWSPASYFAHNDYDPDTQTTFIGDRAINTGNSPMTEAQFASQTVAQLETQSRRDIDGRVFRAVTTYNDGSFPSNPLIRLGGILADMQFAAARGMAVLCYEGGGSHIVVPGAWGAGARARSETWHTTSEYGALIEYCLDRHVTAGTLGTVVFDEGTAHAGQFGCWSWYRDHRDGYGDDAKYSAIQRHHTTGPGALFARVPHPVMVSRAAAPDRVMSPGQNQFALIGAATLTVTAAAPARELSTDPLSAEIGAASVDVTAGAMATGAIANPLTAQIGASLLLVSAADLVHGGIVDPPALFSFLDLASVDVVAAAMAGDLRGDALDAELAAALVETCAAPALARLQTFLLNALLPEARVRMRSLASERALAGATGTMTRSKFWRYERVESALAGFPPHGTTIWRGQLLGIQDGRLRPWRPTDQFIGISLEHESGTEIGQAGDMVLRAYDYYVKFCAQGDVWTVLEHMAMPGDSIYPATDQGFALDPPTPDVEPVGEVVLAPRAGSQHLIRFRGILIGRELLTP